MESLKEVVRDTARFQSAETQNKLICLPTGDGMVLVFFDDPQAPIECAIEIASALRSPSDIRLRMGIHSGPINQITDVNNRLNVAGAGVDMAQRVMDCGDAGHILLSKRVADDLAPYPRWNPHLHDLGECEVKHGRRIALVNFYTDAVGNPKTPAKCSAQAESVAKSAATASTRPSYGRALIGVAALLILGALIGVSTLSRRSNSTGQQSSNSPSLPANVKSIAVLPFENLSADPSNAYFADGIQEEILTKLSKVADLKVISRTSTQRYKSAPTNLREIADQLDVAHILEGSVQKAGDQVRVNVQLINARNDSHLWAEKFDRKLTDIFAVESEIAAKVAETLKAKLSGLEQKAIAAHSTENCDAYELYLKGRFFAAKRLGDNLNKSIDYFNQAIEKDPKFALAHAGLADSYALLPQYTNASVEDCFPKARAAADKAIAIDDNLTEGHTSLGLILSNNDFKFQEAKREFERAIEQNPNHANAHYLLAISVLTPLTEFDRAIAEFKRALQFDPLSLIMNANLGHCYYLARRYPDAIAQLHKTIELDPNFAYAHGLLALALEASGDLPGAIAEFEKAKSFSPDRTPDVFLARAYGLQGQTDKALQLLKQISESSKGIGPVAYGHAIIYLGLGDKNEALDWLEQSYRRKESGVITYIRSDPAFDPLRGDPRFEKLADQVVPLSPK